MVVCDQTNIFEGTWYGEDISPSLSKLLKITFVSFKMMYKTD